MINPIQPNIQSTLMPLDAFAGQKLDRNQDMPRKVVDRKRETSAAKEEVPREQIESGAEKLNKLMGIIGKPWEFQVQEESEGLVVRIIDQRDESVVGDISARRMMEILGTFSKMAGMFFDERV